MKRMHNPPHPGEVLQDTVLTEITVTDFARRLGVSRVALSRVVNGRAAISAELAIRLAVRWAVPPNRGLACRSPTICGRRRRSVGRRSSGYARLRRIGSIAATDAYLGPKYLAVCRCASPSPALFLVRESGGEGGTRTLDLGIMSATL